MSTENSNHKPQPPTFLDSMPLETSTPLESSAPLDFREELRRQPVKAVAPPLGRSIVTPSQPSPTQINETIVEQGGSSQPDLAMDRSLAETYDRQEVMALEQLQPRATSKAAEEVVVQLLEERLVVDRKRRKVGEVIVRKEIETRIIEVPVRREKLIVEQVGSDRPLATIDLGAPDFDSVELATQSVSSQPTISGEFSSIKAASQFLGTIAAAQPNLGRQRVQIKILVEDAEQEQLYQQWFDRYSANSASTEPMTSP